MLVNIETAARTRSAGRRTQATPCAADECMQWRWFDAPVNQVTGKRLPADQRRGCCGFAGAHSVAGGMVMRRVKRHATPASRRSQPARQGPVTAVGGRQVEAGIALSAHDHKGPGYYAPGRVRISPPSFHRPRPWPPRRCRTKGSSPTCSPGAAARTSLTVETRSARTTLSDNSARSSRT